MVLNTYPNLTDASTDSEIIRFWISQKATTTQKTYIMVARQFLTFAGKELRDIKLEDLLLWLESFQLRGKSQNTINNKLAAIKSLFSFGVKTGYLSDVSSTKIRAKERLRCKLRISNNTEYLS